MAVGATGESAIQSGPPDSPLTGRKGTWAFSRTGPHLAGAPRHRPRPRDPATPATPDVPLGSRRRPSANWRVSGGALHGPGQPLPTATSPPRPAVWERWGRGRTGGVPMGDACMYVYISRSTDTPTRTLSRHHGNVPAHPGPPRRLLLLMVREPKPSPIPPTGQSWSPTRARNWRVLEPEPEPSTGPAHRACQLASSGARPQSPESANWPVPPRPGNLAGSRLTHSYPRRPGTHGPRQLASTRPRQLARPSDWSPLPQFHLGPPSQVPPLDSSTDHQGSTEPVNWPAPRPEPEPGRRRSLALARPRGGPHRRGQLWTLSWPPARLPSHRRQLAGHAPGR
ncbi:hypothetical protein P168DRAFT_307952 [Aspergillus campestris IBT 28561]|uniref:Uncharacterized protein n=1 Tax=Aspergillus campestris (strain IBT 28561) TaxID=1392248 RepID=A0A2I1CQ77_ASPC2|nr:uncharacterized protein P168DRAFT_307952 [Aspergillus campestris IBT 28561]PKX99771.1 hypothetical protein P168DRAFT_307952 [Aspergillus campestris IBT 28561]